ncbi:MAG TPA: glycosyl hydrolase [Candidatus Acidoferrales bacterium]|nr:glycosyl hydrolase [Candidatus Acidoferrales bacterium]
MVKEIAAIIFIGGCSAVGQTSPQNVDYNSQTVYAPVNHDATPAAKKLLAYLYSIRGRKTISGLQVFAGAEDKYIYSDYIKALTGKSPELLGYDFVDYYEPGYASQLIQEVYKQFLEGHIVTLMWHQGRPSDEPPFDWRTSIQGKLSDEQWKELITPGTRLYERWLSQVDAVATYLKALQNLGVPILWRPYHEMNGVWFWWGNRKGPDGSARLYKMMYDRYVNYFHLNNLIWVWGPNSPRNLPNDEAYDYADFFPGSDYVDVLAADIYRNDYKRSNYDQLLDLSKGKLVALGEVEEAPTPEILRDQSDWTYFMIWAEFVHTNNSDEQIKELFSDPRTITHKVFIDEQFTNNADNE